MISNAEEFRSLIRQIAESEPNPHKIAELLVDKLRGYPDALALALSLTAPPWVATMVKRPHTTAPTPIPPVSTSLSTGNGFGPAFSNVKPARPQTVTDAEGNQRASRKQAGLVDWYAARLAVSVKFGPSTSDWKRLGECTVADLDWMVAERLSQAAQNTATADKYQRLRDTLLKKKVATVGKLDVATGREILKD